MTDDKASKGSRAERATTGPVHCRRLDRILPVSEHAACPYCYGKSAEIQTGEHGNFCDFKPGEDPISFGFPETHGHYRWDEPPKEAPPADTKGKPKKT